MSSTSDRPVLVSACLLGRRCRYDGSENESPALRQELESRGERALPYCPEEAGGLPTPRDPASLEGHAGEVIEGRARVVTCRGEDVSDAFLAGARGAVDLARRAGAERAYLKEGSPSCGVAATHVGAEKVPGPGVTAELLSRAGLVVEGR